MSFRLLRRRIGGQLVEELSSGDKEGEGKRPCPVCRELMNPSSIRLPEKNVSLDVCSHCTLVWFDPAEYGAVRQAGREDMQSVTEEKKREKRYQASLRWIIAQAQRRRSKAEESAHKLDRGWKWIPVLLGMPVETETAKFLQKPWLTWSLSAAICAVSLTAFSGMVDQEAVINKYGLIPAQFWRYGGFTFLSAFFLHGSLLHLLGNTYFLMVFGDNVEDYVGKRRYLGLLFLADLVGNAFHIALDPRSAMPVVGASGGISGVIAFYALRFPRARIGISLRFYALPMRALLAFAVWILLQIVGAWEQIAGLSNVSSLAHLGGAAVGVFFWLRARDF